MWDRIIDNLISESANKRPAILRLADGSTAVPWFQRPVVKQIGVTDAFLNARVFD